LVNLTTQQNNGKRKGKNKLKDNRDKGEIPKTRATIPWSMLMLETKTKTLVTTIITSKNKGRTIIFRLNSLVHYVASLAITLTITPRLQNINE
jgi:hypothetical protein